VLARRVAADVRVLRRLPVARHESEAKTDADDEATPDHHCPFLRVVVTTVAVVSVGVATEAVVVVGVTIVEVAAPLSP
jgi:hypothetical protein